MSTFVSYRSAKVRVATGTCLHYAEFGKPDGRPVLFLHGWPDSWFSFSRVLRLLPDDLRALAIDQRGFGESDRPESGYSIPEMADDAIAFLDALGIPRATVVGHSFGSFVARRAAIAHPDRVTALALIGTGLSGSNAVTRELQSSLRDLPDPIPVQFARDFQASTAFRPIPPDFFERIIEESLKLPPRLWRLAIDRLIECDDAKELSRIEAPTQLLWGDKDALFSRTEQQRFIDVLPAARLSVYEETGHCPNWEQPERVAADDRVVVGDRDAGRLGRELAVFVELRQVPVDHHRSAGRRCMGEVHDVERDRRGDADGERAHDDGRARAKLRGPAARRLVRKLRNVDERHRRRQRIDRRGNGARAVEFTLAFAAKPARTGQSLAAHPAVRHRVLPARGPRPAATRVRFIIKSGTMQGFAHRP